jgi:hypothetical protein
MIPVSHRPEAFAPFGAKSGFLALDEAVIDYVRQVAGRGPVRIRLSAAPDQIPGYVAALWPEAPDLDPPRLALWQAFGDLARICAGHASMPTVDLDIVLGMEARHRSGQKPLPGELVAVADPDLVALRYDVAHAGQSLPAAVTTASRPGLLISLVPQTDGVEHLGEDPLQTARVRQNYQDWQIQTLNQLLADASSSMEAQTALIGTLNALRRMGQVLDKSKGKARVEDPAELQDSLSAVRRSLAAQSVAATSPQKVQIGARKALAGLSKLDRKFKTGPQAGLRRGPLANGLAAAGASLPRRTALRTSSRSRLAGFAQQMRARRSAVPHLRGPTSGLSQGLSSRPSGLRAAAAGRVSGAGPVGMRPSAVGSRMGRTAAGRAVMSRIASRLAARSSVAQSLAARAAASRSSPLSPTGPKGRMGGGQLGLAGGVPRFSGLSPTVLRPVSQGGSVGAASLLSAPQLSSSLLAVSAPALSTPLVASPGSAVSVPTLAPAVVSAPAPAAALAPAPTTPLPAAAIAPVVSPNLSPVRAEGGAPAVGAPAVGAPAVGAPAVGAPAVGAVSAPPALSSASLAAPLPASPVPASPVPASPVPASPVADSPVLAVPAGVSARVEASSFAPPVPPFVPISAPAAAPAVEAAGQAGLATGALPPLPVMPSQAPSLPSISVLPVPQMPVVGLPTPPQFVVAPVLPSTSPPLSGPPPKAPSPTAPPPVGVGAERLPTVPVGPENPKGPEKPKGILETVKEVPEKIADLFKKDKGHVCQPGCEHDVPVPSDVPTGPKAPPPIPRAEAIIKITTAEVKEEDKGTKKEAKKFLKKGPKRPGTCPTTGEGPCAC